MKRANLCTFAFLCLSPCVMAAEYKKKEANPSIPNQIEDVDSLRRRKNHTRDERDNERTRSEDARRGKKWVLLGEMGLVDVLHFGIGANVGHYLNDRSIVEAEAFRANFEFLGYKSVTTTFLGRYRFFTGNSFGVFGGAGFRVNEHHNESVIFSSSTDQHASFSSMSIVVDGGIGNRWQMDSGLAIGCDWVGLTTPIAQMSSSESYGDGLSESRRSEEKSDFDSYSRRSSLNVVRFHIGASF